MKNYNVIPLGEILNLEYSQTKIEEAFKKFSCQRETDLEDFLTYKAIPYQKTGFGKTYLCVDSEKLEQGEMSIMAYFTIAQKSVDITSLSNKRKRKVLGNYPGRDHLETIPAYLIGQLGRNDQYSNDDLSGEQLLNECYHAISMAAMIVGGNMLVLECRQHMFGKFYEKQGFKKLYDEVNDEDLYTLYKKIDFSEYWSRY